ncbi:MAG: helix-turn-helix transcriptional regulator [Oscillospiraceae bacterium]|nr:helix-turn-helix transcriptional regulator [Oscillospiraceae bacterium]
MKQDDLASRLSVRRQTVSRYEIGQLDLDTDTIRRLCEIFHVSADYLLGFSSRRTPEISPEDMELLAAYHAATPEIRAIIDTALEPYKEKRQTAAG